MLIKKEVGLEDCQEAVCALAQSSKLISFLEVLLEQIGDDVSAHFDEIPQEFGEKIQLMVSTGLHVAENYNYEFLSCFVDKLNGGGDKDLE